MRFCYFVINNFKLNKMKIVLAQLFCLFIFVIMFVRCQQDDDLYVIDDRPYLEFPETINFYRLTDDDLEIIGEAFSRLSIIENADGLLEIRQKRAEDVNISNEMFDYFKVLIDERNERFLSDLDAFFNSVLTRQESGGNSKTDCVAQAIVYATGLSYDKVNSWITDTYGNNGVPANSFYTVMNHFCQGGAVSVADFKNMNLTSSGYKYIAVINNTHAVNVYGIASNDPNTIVYYDAQTGKPGIASISTLTHIYEIR